MISQKPQNNFPRFLELFSNFYYLTANHTADRSIVLAQKHPNFTFKVHSNGPLVLDKGHWALMILLKVSIKKITQ